MAGRAVEVSADASDFVALFGKTSTVDKKLRTSLRKKMRAAADGAAEASRREVLKPPMSTVGVRDFVATVGAGRERKRRNRSRGLRRGIASGIKVQLATGAAGKRVGVFIKATGSSLSGGRKVLVRRYERARWRHPVFGDRTTWVTQAGRPYFRSVIQAERPDIEKAVRAALDEAKAHVAGRSTAL